MHLSESEITNLQWVSNLTSTSEVMARLSILHLCQWNLFRNDVHWSYNFIRSVHTGLTRYIKLPSIIWNEIKLFFVWQIVYHWHTVRRMQSCISDGNMTNSQCANRETIMNISSARVCNTFARLVLLTFVRPLHSHKKGFLMRWRPPVAR